MGSDPQGHLFGTQAIIRAAEQQYQATTGPSFRQAIYWAAFRQELWISLMTQRAFSSLQTTRYGLHAPLLILAMCVTLCLAKRDIV
jgi:hypothetical protein